MFTCLWHVNNMGEIKTVGIRKPSSHSLESLDALKRENDSLRSVIMENHMRQSISLGKFNDTNWGFPGGSVVKNRLPVQETWVRSLIREDPICH